MRRRDFIRVIAGSAVWPLDASAQQRLRRIGVLIGTAEDDARAQSLVRAFVQRLQELGWNEGHSARIEYRWSGGNLDRIAAYAKELVSLSPDVVLSNSAPVLTALQRQTRSIPIVFVAVSDPVAGGFVESLAKPGGNITGFTPFERAIVGKWLELLKEVAPGVTRVQVIGNPANASISGQMRILEAAAYSFSIQPIAALVKDAADIERAIDAFARDPNGGLLALPDISTIVHREAIIGRAVQHGLPAVYPYRLFAASGGLLSYGPDTIDQYRAAAAYVDRILRGEKPSDLPVQAPTKYELVINAKTAKALGLTVPPSLLARADEVIE